MDEGDFPGGNALCHEILLHVVIHGERAGCGNDCIHIDDAESIVLNIFLFRRFPDKSAVHIDKRPGFQLLPCSVRGCLGLASPGCGQVTKNKLRAPVRRRLPPDGMDALDSGIDF